MLSEQELGGGGGAPSPSDDSWVGRSGTQPIAGALLPWRGGAAEQRGRLREACPLYTQAHVYSLLESLRRPPPSPMKSDHPTQLLFLSLAHLRNFNTAEYS